MHTLSVTTRRNPTRGITRIRKSKSWLPAILMFVAFFLGTSGLALAATRCVNPGGTGGCFASINAAVAAASSNDTIQVAAGTYHEDVVVPMPMSIVGAGAGHSIVDATGLSNGFDIDGHHHPGLSHVVVSGFTVKNANFQGILITDASYVTIWDNHVTGNDKSLMWARRRLSRLAPVFYCR